MHNYDPSLDHAAKPRWRVRILPLLLGGFFLLSAFVELGGAIGERPEPVDVLDLRASELEAGRSYLIEELVVVDGYAYAYASSSSYVSSLELAPDDDRVTKNYYLVAFWDRDDTLCAASLAVDTDEDISDRLIDYQMDSGAYIGDVELPGYFRAAELEDGLDEYLRESVDDYSEVLGPLELVEMDLVYELAADGDYAAHARGLRNADLAMAAASALVGLLCVFGGLYRKKEKPAPQPAGHSVFRDGQGPDLG